MGVCERKWNKLCWNVSEDMQNKVFKYLSYVGLVGEGPDVGLELEKLQRKKEKKIEDSVSGNRAFRVVSFRGGGAKLTRRELILDRTGGGGITPPGLNV